MARKRYIQDPDTGELIPAEQYVPKYELNPHNLIIGDRHYDGLQATDGTDISTRTKHREYMKKNGLTIADDFKGEWSRAAKERADYYQGKRGTITKNDIALAIHQLESRRNGTSQ